MFSVLNINLASFTNMRFGPSVTAVGITGSGRSAQTSFSPGELSIPWQDVQEKPDVFSLLSWHTRLSDFKGRDVEMAELQQWVRSEQAISIKFVTAEGGVGKSRLAAEFAKELRQQDWAAGFVNLRKPESFTMNKEGTLLVIDYPEEHRDGIAELLSDLAHLEPKLRLRVLFLTRQQIEQWQGFIRDCNALNLLDIRPIELFRLKKNDAYEIFNTVQERAAEIKQTTPLPISKEDFLEWLYKFPENERPLFIVASSVKTALDPDEPVFGYKGREIIESLAERELSHLCQRAANKNIKDKYAFARILAMAAIADILPVDYVSQLCENDELKFGFPSDCHVGDELEAAGIVSKDAIHAPKPDILAAAFVVKTLANNPKTAPEIIWACLSQDITGGLERLGRLSFDAEITLQMLKYRLGDWLSKSIMDNVDRCTSLWPLVYEIAPVGLCNAAITVCRTLLKKCENEEEKALLLNNLSVYLSDVGDTTGALEAIKEAVEIYRKISEVSPQRYLPYVAMSLNNMSNRLSAIGNIAGALEAIKEALEIRRKLSEVNPQRYLPDLATSLNNLSNHLSDVGDTTGALEAIKKAIEIYRKLSEVSPQRYLPYLAMSLNGLSSCLSAIGDTTGALEAIKEAVEIRRKLSEASPQRYLPDLSMSLNNLSNCLSDIGDNASALDAIKEAVEIYRKLSEAISQRYLPDLATSLNNLSNRLSAVGDTAGALDAVKEAVEISRKLSEASPQRYLPDLAGSLNNLSNRLSDVGDTAGALEAIKEAVEVYRKLSEASPQRYLPDLASSLNNLSSSLSDVGDTGGALEAIKEAVEIYRKLSEASPQRYLPDLARSLGVLGTIFLKLKEYRKAEEAFSEGVDLIRPFAERLPKSPFEKLKISLESNLERIRKAF